MTIGGHDHNDNRISIKLGNTAYLLIQSTEAGLW